MNREDKRARSREERRAERAEAASATPTAAEAGPLVRERTSPPQFLREVRSELRKVAWPSRREVAVYTVTVLVVTALLTTIVWGFDYVLRETATRFL